ncbi:MAG: Lar family restriction alleviation protein [Candidatus Peribacteraceae bacterium]|nr:Lar family restriction alleviation protein [Candidatus Peribacteraceae bacterium]
MSEKPKNCPFCGGVADVGKYELGFGTADYRGKCRTCGATGPPAINSVGAKEAWDKRVDATQE